MYIYIFSTYCVASTVLSTEGVREEKIEPWRGLHPGKQIRTKQCDTTQDGVSVCGRERSLPPLPIHPSWPTNCTCVQYEGEASPVLAGGENSLTSDHKKDYQSESTCSLLLESSRHRPRECSSPLSPQVGPPPEGRLRRHEESPSPRHFLQHSFSRMGGSQG